MLGILYSGIEILPALYGRGDNGKMLAAVVTAGIYGTGVTAAGSSRKVIRQLGRVAV